MSGHSKWSNIKRKKEVNDKQKGKIFSKLSSLITLAVIEGGGVTNADNNVKLRLAIDKAKQENLPKDNIERAIEKGVGPNQNMLKEVVYEAFGPHGIGLLILTTTDSSNRTLSEVRNTLERNGGKLGNHGSVAYLFKKCGSAVFTKEKNSAENILDFTEKISAFDIEEDEVYYQVFFPYEHLGKLKDYLGNLIPESSELDYRSTSKSGLTDGQVIEKIAKLVEALEELDDVYKVWTNL